MGFISMALLKNRKLDGDGARKWRWSWEVGETQDKMRWDEMNEVEMAVLRTIQLQLLP